MIRVVALIFATTLAACSNANRYYGTSFEPTGPAEFRYAANADSAMYPVEDAEAEGTRRRWLEQYLADNKLCPKGYEIVDRRAVKTAAGLVADSYRIYYRGRCRS